MTTARIGHGIRQAHVALAGIYHHALATGFARDFEVTAGIMLLALVIAAATIRIRDAALDLARA